MTTAELVEILQDYPSDLRVVVNGYEDGYDDLSPEQVSLVRIALNTGKHDWEGKHGHPNGLAEEPQTTASVVDADAVTAG